MASRGPTAAAAATAAEPETDRHTLIVPGPDVPGGRTFLVNFPGYVNNEDRALATLGGPAGLAAQRTAHPKTLQLRLRPGDLACHPIISNDAHSASCLVLRLTRPAAAGDEPHAAAEVEAELVAAVNRAYSFSSPADYQYTARDLRPNEVQWAGRPEHTAECSPFLQPAPLLVTPPVFAVEGPLDYGFRQYKAEDHGVDVLGRRTKTRGPAPTWIDFLATDVPAAADEGAWVGSAAGEGAAARLGELLRRRPVFLEGALGAALGEEGGNAGSHSGFPSTRAHMEALCALCYRFRNGPWQGAWVRRGYDPRSDPAARSTQVMSHAMPAEWWRQVAAAKEAGAAGRRPGRGAAAAEGPTPAPALPPLASTYAALTSFAGLQATPMAALQLCDVSDAEVAAALADPSNVAPAVNEASGWLTQATWEGIKARVASRFEALWAEAAAAAAGSATQNAEADGAAPSGADADKQAGILPEGLLTELTTFLEAERGPPGVEGGAGAAVAEEEEEEEEAEEEDLSEGESGGEEDESDGSGDDD